MLDPYEIVNAIQAGVRWEPLVTPALVARYHLDHFAQLHPPGGLHLWERGEAPSPPYSSGGGLVITPPAGPGGAIVLNPNDNHTVNISFNENLFGSYKISSIKCKALRDKILQRTLVALPRSKVNTPSQCAWHGTPRGSAMQIAPVRRTMSSTVPPSWLPWLRGVLLVMLLQHKPPDSSA